MDPAGNFQPGKLKGTAKGRASGEWWEVRQGGIESETFQLESAAGMMGGSTLPPPRRIQREREREREKVDQR